MGHMCLDAVSSSSLVFMLNITITKRFENGNLLLK